MELDWQNIQIPFAGLDTKTHPAHVSSSSSTELENGIFIQTGAINKRNGYSQLDNVILGTGNRINTAAGSAVYSDTDLLLFTGNDIYSWAPSMDRWNDRGTCTALQVNYNNIIANSNQQTNPDIAYSTYGIELYAWDDNRGGIRYSMIDSQTKSQLATDILLTSIGQHPKCISFYNNFYIIYWLPGGAIVAALIAPGNPSHPNNYSLASDANVVNISFDVSTLYDGSGGQYLAIAYVNNANSITAISYNQNLIANSSTTIAENPVSGVCCYGANFDNVFWIGYGLANGDVKCFSIAATGGQVSDVTVIDSNQVITHITAIQISGLGVGDSTNSDIQFYYDIQTTTRPYIRTNVINYNGSGGPVAGLGNPGLFINSVSLASKAWFYNTRWYLNAVYGTGATSDLQPTYFTLNNFAEVVSKSQQDIAGGFRSAVNLSEVVSPTAGEFIFATERRGAIVSENNTVFALKGVSGVKLQFTNSYKSVMLNETLHLTGGILQQYDGNAVVEHGFNLFPENISYIAGFLGNIDDGIYSYQFTYEWTDLTGKIERSAPSPAIQLTLNQGTNSVLFSIPTYCLTKKSNVRLVVYRTQQATSGIPFMFRITSIEAPILNSKTTDFILFVDTQNDSAIMSNDVLYCSPDTNAQLIELENIAAPNCTITTTYGNRVWLAGLDNPNQIWFSKTVVPGEPAAFNDAALTLDMISRGGSITALAVLNTNLIIFKESSIFFLSGIGPDNTGANSDFGDPQVIASDVGCINQNSTVLVSSQGLFFQSSKGIYLLTQGLTTEYIGAPVEKYNNQTIVAATQVPNTTQVRFVCSDGNCLVYDYYVNTWATFTNHLAVDAGVWNNNFYFVKQNGIVNNEVIGSFSDNSTPIQLKYTTSWLSFAGLTNYQKIRDFLLLGDFKGYHQLQISIAYDGNETFFDNRIIDTSVLFDIITWGQRNLYGNNSPPPWGGTFDQYLFRIIPSQRCQRFKIKIQELQPTVANKGLALVGLNFRVGVKRGLGKVAPTNQFGI